MLEIYIGFHNKDNILNDIIIIFFNINMFSWTRNIKFFG
jgi:hypothetical protein